MRDLFKKILVGTFLLFSPQVFAEDFKVVIIPDNIVTENVAVDSFIYNATAEFFADEVATILNDTDFIYSPTVSETRNKLKNDPSMVIATKNLTSRFRTSYNVDYLTLKKISSKNDAKYALLLTSHIDSENYVLRRTVWDFLNIPGATVVDPAYKISTYAVLVDTEKNVKLWADTYYKTISVCENRIITRGTSPQTEQLQKIKDYSKYICPQIAQNVQLKVLPASLYAKESNQIYYDIGNIDNVFTKKYRHLSKEYDKVYQITKSDVAEKYENTKTKIKNVKEDWDKKQAEKAKLKQDSKLEVKATPLYLDSNISNKTKEKKSFIKNAIWKKNDIKDDNVNYYEVETPFEGIEIKKTKKNNLYIDIDSDRPDLRDYYN